MRRSLSALILNGFLAASALYAQNPPCNSGVHTAFNEKIIPIQNGQITYCISDFGWSDTWLLGSPTTYNIVDDVLSGDDAFNLKYNTPPGGLGAGSGWLSPSLDQGVLSAQDAPGWSARQLWTVVTSVHATGPSSTESVIANADGLQITIDAFAPPGATGVEISLTILNTTTGKTFTGLRLADYFNFHPNGSNSPNNFLGTTVFDGNCLVTTGQPIAKLDATMCGIFAPVAYEVGLAYAKGAAPAVWQDVTLDSYNGNSGPVGPDDSAGALLWALPDLPPGASTRFAVGKNVTFPNPPTIAKAFNPSQIPLFGTSALSFTVTNPNAVQLTGISFSDILPAGVAIAIPNGLTGSCGGGTISAASGQVTLANATLPGKTVCTFSINVIGNVAGQFTNNTSHVKSIEGGDGNAATAVLTVVPPPFITKSFGASKIIANNSTTLTFTIMNPGAIVTLTGVSFADSLPAGLVVASTPGATNTCGGTLVGITPGSTNIGLTGGSIAPGATCAITVSVTGITGGTKNNSTNIVTSNEGGPGNSASATLTVVPVIPPVITKNFNPAQIPLNGTSVMTITVNNPNPDIPLTSVAFADPFPAGIAVAAPPLLSSNCGGTLTGGTAGSTSLSLSGATLAPGVTCTIQMNVVGSVPGALLNSAGPVTAAEPATPGNTATATLTVVGPPVLTKAFNPVSIPQNAASTLTFTIHNPNATVPLTIVGFTDSFPAGVAIGATPNLSNGCGGTLNGATAGSTSLSLTGVTLAPNATCTISMSVTGLTVGLKTNITSAVTSVEGGPGQPATGILTVNSQPIPTFAKTFVPSQIPVQAGSLLTLVITPPPGVGLTGVSFSDPFPVGVQVASTPNLVNTCGGTLSGVTPGSVVLTLTGGAVPAGGCTISINVTGVTPGLKLNTTSGLTSNEYPPQPPAVATLVVIAPPQISKTFFASTIPLNGTSMLTILIANPNGPPNPVTLTGVGFTDNFPAGVVVASPPNLSNTCNGTLSGTTAGSASVALSGATLAGGASCTITINVTGNTPGTKNNVTTVVTSTEGGPGNSGIATLVVITPAAQTYLLTYLANLDKGDSFIDITNTGASGAGLQSGTTASVTGSLCANVYVFSPDEQLVSCCSCPVTPNGLVSLSANSDLVSNTLTPSAPTSVVVKIVPTLPVANSCVNSAAALNIETIGPGLEAFSTTLHQTPAANYTPTEKRFSPATLSPDELTRLNSLCNFNIANGSGFGICRSCRLGGLGSARQ